MLDSASHPRNNTVLIGHDEAETLLAQDLSGGRLAHGILISGPKGIGKATFAYRFARTLLTGEGAARRMAAGSHSDLLVVEPLYDAKKEEYARELSVDQAREISQFLSLTPGEGKWRVVIIDSADALNSNAANAILKILEEPPPQAVLLLISHNPGRLLPTIRSRCRSLRLTPLSQESFTTVMQHVAPDMSEEDVALLAQLSELSPGIAMELHGQGAGTLYQQIVELLPDINPLKLHAFADRIGSGTVHANWQLLTRLMLTLLARVARQSAGGWVDGVSPEETRLLHRLCELHPAAMWAAKWQQCADQFLLAERLHLDYKQVIIAFFHSLAEREAFQIGNAA